MKNKTLIKTNLLVCIIIIAGFIVTSFISYQSNIGMLKKDVEMVATLTSDGIYNEITSIFSQPVSVALTMASDNLLKEFLTDEKNSLVGEEWENRMREYLNAYRIKYGYDSVFLASTTTNNYYHFEGLDRTITPNNPENKWYYDFLEKGEEYSLNVDNDEATDNSITIFVNCKITNGDGYVLGIVGVGLKVDSLQTLLGSYEEKYGVHAYLVGDNGAIEISSLATKLENKNLFEDPKYSNNKNMILQNKKTQENFWYSSKGGGAYVVARYEPNLKWYLVIENDTSSAYNQISVQLFRNIIIIAFIMLLVLIIITTVIRRYDVRVTELGATQELEYERLLNKATGELYDEIYEWNITHNCACGASTKAYLESLGLSPEVSYDKALHAIASRQIKKEYIQGYLDAFAPAAVLESYKNGVSNLNYDFMMAKDGINFRWTRISAQLFYWSSEDSLRMITYRKNIDDEKKRELALLEDVQRDSMTKLYNKRATEQLIEEVLKNEINGGSRRYAFLIFDIDNFKTVNDTLGHSFGDNVINELSAEIKTQFKENDIVGRIGGDEFAVLMRMNTLDGLKEKLARLCSKIDKKDFGVGENLKISCSVGAALFNKDGKIYSELYEKADQALYYAKNHGKNTFAICGEYGESNSFYVTQRDMELVIDISADGIVQYACTEPLKLLYFNRKSLDLFGFSASVLTSPDFDPMALVHPDDEEEVQFAFKEAATKRQSFARSFRVRHQDGHYMSLSLKGVFMSELYKNKYPVMYVMYMKDGDE